MTVEEMLEGGSAGSFAEAVCKAYKDPTIENLLYAYVKADGPNRARLGRLFPEIHHIGQVLHGVWLAHWPTALRAAFPILGHLNEVAGSEHFGQPMTSSYTGSDLEFTQQVLTALDERQEKRDSTAKGGD